MTCAQCGTPNPKRARFCRGCGTSLQGAALSDSAPPRRSRTWQTVAIALAAVVVVLAVAVIALASSGKSDRTVVAPETTTTAILDRTPGEVLVQVLNGSGINLASQTKSNELRAKGYKIAPPANATVRTGNAVQCKPGFEREADALAHAVGTGTTVEPFPNPAPTGTPTDLNCLVILGRDPG